MPDVDDEEDLTKGHYRIINGYVLKTHDRDKAKRTIYINIFKCAELEVNHVVVDNVTTWKSKADSTRSTVLSIIVSTPTFHKAQLNTGFKPIVSLSLAFPSPSQCAMGTHSHNSLRFFSLS